jgi:hypothetical protein
MSGAAPSTIRPKYVALDTSTWINLFKRRTDPEVKDILDALNSGQIIPYVCYDHVLELLQYDDQSIREHQLDFFGEIQLVGFPNHFPSPPWRNSPICASYLDVQESEISALLDAPNLGLEQVLERARPLAVAGLSGGRAIAGDPVFRDIARTGRATQIVQLNRAAASMIHSSPQNPDEVIPEAGSYRMLDPQGAEQLRPQLIAALAEQLRFMGDPRLQNIDQLAAEIVELSFQQILPNYDPSAPDPFRAVVSGFLGVDLSRLPTEATRDDFVLETLYRGRMALHERRMRLEDGAAYKAITRDRLPSMVAWFAIEREAKSNMPTAEGGNMIDFPLAAFALYIDKVQVDKRVLNHIEVAARKNPFLERILPNVFRAKDLKDILGVLNSL